MPKMPFLAEEKIASSGKPRSPSPPIRRSISTDRGAHIRSRIKGDVSENQPIARIPFPARVPVNKSLATIPMIPSTDHHNSRVLISSQDPTTRQDNISDTLYSLQKVTTKKVHQEHEDEQFKQALNIRQGGIRKSKPESKAKAKQHQIIPVRLQKSDVVTTLLSDLEVGEKVEEAARKSDFSEPENEHVPVGSPVHGALKVKKLRQNFSKNSQNLEPRYT